MVINLADNTPRISYTVNQGATQTAFAVPFEFFADADLNVYVDGTKKSLSTHYTTSANAQNNSAHIEGETGYIHTTANNSVVGATGGSTVVITRDIVLSRTSDFPTAGAFDIKELNDELDRNIAVASDLNDLATRTIRLKDFDSPATLELPIVTDRANRFLKFDANGNLTTDLAPSDLGVGASIIFEGATADAYETTLTVTDPTGSDKTITLPNATGTVSLTSNTETLTNKTLTTPTIAQINASSAFTVDTTHGIDLDYGFQGTSAIRFFLNGGSLTSNNPFGSISHNSNSAGNLAIHSGTTQVIDFTSGGGGNGKRMQIRGDLNLHNSAPLLAFRNTETNVVDGTVLGTIEFFAPMEDDPYDAQEVAASIVAEADATFTATANNTDLVFKLGTSGAATEKARLTHEGNLVVSNDLTVTGNLTINGTTSTVNSTTVTVDDPIFTLGGDTAPDSDDNKDRGIEFRYYDGSAKVGFFGFDESVGKFTFIPDATNSSEVFSGTAGTIVANLEGAVTGNVTGTATNATHVAVADNESTDENNLIPFIEDASATGNVGLESDGDFHYNPSTGKLTATQLAGTLQTASQTNITGVGTISTGVWNGTAIAQAYIGGDAINADKIADDAVESEHLNDNVISDQTEISSGLADADEMLYSDGGTLKKVGVDTLKTYMNTGIPTTTTVRQTAYVNAILFG